jgi:hypothetical protein
MGDTAQFDMIVKFLPHTHQHGCIDILHCSNDPCLQARIIVCLWLCVCMLVCGHVCVHARVSTHVCVCVAVDLSMWVRVHVCGHTCERVSMCVCECMVHFMLHPLYYWGKRPWCSVDRRLVVNRCLWFEGVSRQQGIFTVQG